MNKGNAVGVTVGTGELVGMGVEVGWIGVSVGGTGVRVGRTGVAAGAHALTETTRSRNATETDSIDLSIGLSPCLFCLIGESTNQRSWIDRKPVEFVRDVEILNR